MEDKYKNKYRTTPVRLSGWDYGSHGLYFVTICTKDRVNYFGEIGEDGDGAHLNATEIGEVAHHNWLTIPQFSPYIELDKFVVMPDHLHGILFINKPDKNNWEVNKFGAQSQNLASAIRGYKASVKSYATQNAIDFLWQPKYYDHIIRNEKEYQNICRYIDDNPRQWLLKGGDDNEMFF